MLDEASTVTALPDGTQLEVEVFGVDDEELDPADREALEAALDESERDFEAGRYHTAEEVLAELRQQVDDSKRRP